MTAPLRRPDQVRGRQLETHQSWLDRRWIMAAYGAFTAYAAIIAIFDEDHDRIWALCAGCAYGAATIVL